MSSTLHLQSFPRVLKMVWMCKGGFVSLKRQFRKLNELKYYEAELRWLTWILDTLYGDLNIRLMKMN
jgi:hypothetical protein